MKPVLAALSLILALSMPTPSIGQETITVGQLLEAGNLESSAFSAALYILGWKEGTSLELTNEAQGQQVAGGAQASVAAARLELGDCLSKLGVADLVAALRAALRDETITP